MAYPLVAKLYQKTIQQQDAQTTRTCAHEQDPPEWRQRDPWQLHAGEKKKKSNVLNVLQNPVLFEDFNDFKET